MPVKRKTYRRRPKVNPRQVLATGWVWLMIGLLLALFFGGAVRALLSERQVRQWVEKKWQAENPPYFLSFESARVVLREGWRPKFGLEVKGISLLPHDPCGRGHKIQIQDLFLPGPIGILWGEPARFGRLQANKVVVEKLEACPESKPAPDTISVSGSSLSQTAPPSAEAAAFESARMNRVKEFLQKRWPQELAQTAKWLDGVVLYDVDIRGVEIKHLQDFHIHRLELKLSRDGQSAEVNSELTTVGPIADALLQSQLQMQLRADANKLTARAHLPIREGQMTVNSTVDLSTLKHSGEFTLGFVPASAVVEVFKVIHIVTDPISLKRSWVAAEGAWQGTLFARSPFDSAEIRNLKLSGDTGMVTLGKLDLRPEGKKIGFDPFTVVFDDFSFRYLIEALGRKGYTGVVGDFGLLSGQLRVDSPQDMSFRGYVDRLALNFSRQSVRAVQKVNSLRFDLELKGPRVAGMVRDFELDEGVLRGSVSVNLDRQVLNGLFQIRVDELSFHPSVQKVMTGGSLSPIAIYGRGQMKDGHVSQWSGEVGVKNITAQDWQVDTLKIRSEFANSLMVLQAKANRLILKNGHDLGERFKPVLAKYPKLQADLNLQYLSGRLEISSQNIKWRNASASIGSGEVLLATTGSSEGGQVDAQLSVDLPGAKMVRWRIQGPWNAVDFIGEK